jgi:hypothetical protein
MMGGEIKKAFKPENGIPVRQTLFPTFAMFQSQIILSM